MVDTADEADCLALQISIASAHMRWALIHRMPMQKLDHDLLRGTTEIAAGTCMNYMQCRLRCLLEEEYSCLR